MQLSVFGWSPSRAVATGIQAAEAVASVASAGLEFATEPVRAGIKLLSGEVFLSTLTRRHWRGDGRAWIEVRDLNSRGGAERGRAVLDALRARPGVTSAELNRPLSRVVVEFDGEKTSLGTLCSVVGDAEKRPCQPCQADGPDTSQSSNGLRGGDSLPGDGLLLAARAAMVGVHAGGLAIAVVGRTLRLPAAPVAVDAAVAIAKYQPWLRRLLEDRIGTQTTGTVLSLATAVAHTLTLSPATLAVELTTQALQAAECRAGERAWIAHEPALARHAEQPEVHQQSGPVPARPAGPAERYLKRVALAQLIGAGLVGAVTRSVAATSTAAVVVAPKAMWTTREAFAATLGQGLADRYGVLPLRPEALRRLDEVDALLVDPRVLCDEKLQVVTSVPGVQRSDRRRPIEELISPAHHPLAAAVTGAARASGVKMVSVDFSTGPDILGDLRPAFDDIRPVDPGVNDGELDDTLADTLADLQQAGHTVAVLSSTAGRALVSAHVALGIMPAGATAASQPRPPWEADLILADLSGAWQVLRALPAARAAVRRGITLSASASALGAVLMVPGARARRGRGPGPVTLGAAAGLLSGYLLARRVVRTPAPRPAPTYHWHAMSVQQVRNVLPPPDTDTGATVVPASTQSPNALRRFVKAVGAELSDPLTPVMAVGSAATALLGSPTDAVMVGTVLTGNAMLAAAQQLRAESRLNLLLARQTPPARKLVTGPGGTQVYREVIAERLRPGDVIEVRSNEVVPADARLIAETDLEVDESSLTGESLSVGKQVEATPGADLADRRCMLYAGTTVIAGTAVALVTAVGADTQTRRAAELACGEFPVVGLQRQLSRVMHRALPVSISGGALVGALSLLRRGGLRQALGDAIAIAVAAVPEGMPLMATLAQYASVRRLSSSGALVRVPRSVEALGRLDVVCFDKTGTLSENRLRVTLVHPVSGHTRDSGDEVLRVAACAAPEPEGAAHAHATDQAIIEAAAEIDGVSSAPAPDAFLPFRSGRAFSAAVSGGELMIKGAPEVVLAACAKAGAGLENIVDDLAAGGLRVIAVARRRLTPRQAQAISKDPDSIVEYCGAGLTLTGFLGLADTPRTEAPQLLADLAGRGVEIRLITGDHPITATAIAAELGVAVQPSQVITGSEWNALSRRDQERAVRERVVFARMSPENKVQIVATLERAGRVCAMVGDGANDVAAIRAATVGVGVVARGSDSAHTIADVVLTDGHIGSLVDAIDEGRRLWRGVQAAVAGLLGGNAGEVIFAVIGTALTGTSPLNTRQLLLMNMLTDALPATAVAVSTPAGPVQRVGQGLDERLLWRAVTARGAITAAAATAAWAMASITGRRQRAATVALIALVCVELGQTLVDSHAPLVLLTSAGSFAAFMAMISTPGVSQLLGCTPVGPLGWAQGLGAAAVATLAVAAVTGLPAGRRALAPLTPPAAGIDSTPDAGSRDSSAAPPRRRRATAPRKAPARAASTNVPRLKLVGRAEHLSST